MEINKSISFKEELSVLEYLELVDDFVESNFADGEYRPDYGTVSEDAILLSHCSDSFLYEDGEAVTVDYDLMHTVEENEMLKGVLPIIKDTEYYKKARIDADKRIDNILHGSSVVEEKLLELLEKESKKLDAEIDANLAAETLVSAQTVQTECANKLAEQFTPEEYAELMRKMSDSNFDITSVADLIADKYFQSSAHDEKVNGIIDSKNNEIVELKKYKQAVEARNVLNKKE